MFSYQDLWEAMDDGERREACLSFWVSDDKVTVLCRPRLVAALAELLRFREKFLLGRPTERRADWLLERMPHPDLRRFLDDVIRAWLVHRHSVVIGEFLDACGIDRDGCFVADDAPPPGTGNFRKGISAIRRVHGDRIPALYLGFMVAKGTDDFWGALEEALGAEGFDPAKVLAGESDGLAACPAGAEAGPEPLPEEGEAMTMLDTVLIKTIVASVLGVDGALSPDMVENLVEEVVDLNADRHQSFFHRGYLHALTGRKPGLEFPGTNEQRRSWYAEGFLLGRMRSSDQGTCVRLLRDDKALSRLLFTGNTTGCGARLLRHLYRPLRDAGEFGMLKEWIQNQFPRMSQAHRESLLVDMQEDGSALLRRGKAAEAKTLLDFVDVALRGDGQLDPRLRAVLTPRNMRKRAQVMQAQGNFTTAREILEGLLAMPTIPDEANTMTDLGLIRGGFRSLAAILPPHDPKGAATICQALQKGKPDFLRAIERQPDSSANAHFCLGMMDLLGESPSARMVDFFQQALLDMLKREEFYLEGGLIHWARFGLAFGLLNTVEPANLQQAGERLDQVMESEIPIPGWLWVRALSLLSLFDDQIIVQRLVDHLLKVGGGSIFDAIGENKLHALPGIRKPFLEWLGRQPMTAERRWTLLTAMLGGESSQAGIELDRDILDVMEGMAIEDAGSRARLIALLSSAGPHDPAWSSAEREMALVHLHELDGNFALAAEQLAHRFYRLRDGGRRHELLEARQLAEVIHAYRLDPDPSAGMPPL